MMRAFLFLLFTVSLAVTGFSQYTSADSIRGGYGPGRNWWDLAHYDLSVSFNEQQKSVSGSNTIRFTADPSELKIPKRTLQIDLQDPMVLDSVIIPGNQTITGEELQHRGNAYFIPVSEKWTTRLPGTYELTVYYHGVPHEAKKAPWDGGIIWKKDPNGKSWITIACQGLGASVWFPCKDSQKDEPDSVSMHYTCNAALNCISNGRLQGKQLNTNGTATYSWVVKNPINNYCMIPYIGDYVNMHQQYKGEAGMLDVDYWVIRGNEEKAREHFKDVPRTLEAFEYWFGPYPFYADGYKLIEAPHLGMEHQSAVAYGNEYKMGYLGRDLSGTGEGLKWDFIIVHESGHEWFGNNITSTDIADMWIHESFTNYSEALFTDYWYRTPAGNAYEIGLRKNIVNDRPIIGDYGVNSEGSGGDMYYKGSNMLHTIRQLTGNDTTFRKMLREMNHKYYHQTVTTEQIEQFMADFLDLDLKPVFDQYLRTKNPPTLELAYDKNTVKYRWKNCVEGFDMPIELDGLGKVTPTENWQKATFTGNPPTPNANYYIKLEKAAN